MKFDKIVETEKKNRGTNEKKGLMLHHTAGGTFDSNMRIMSVDNSYKASVHYVLGRNGEVGKIGSHDDILWHAGDGSNLWDGGIENVNKYYIGIEVVSDRTGGGFTEKQKNKLPELVRYICEKESIKDSDIHRHAQTSLKGKFDLNLEFFLPLTFDEWKDNISNKKTKMQKAIDSVLSSNSLAWYELDDKDRKAVEECSHILRSK